MASAHERTWTKVGDRLSRRREWGKERRNGRGTGGFLLRWVAAVALSMIAAGAVQYNLAVHQIEQRNLREQVKAYSAELSGLRDVLAADLPPAARAQAIEHELRDIRSIYGTRYVAVFDQEGRRLGQVGGKATSLAPEKIQMVLASGTLSAKTEQDGGQAEQENRYEFLLPLRTSDGLYAVEVDQRADIIGQLLADLRLRMLLGLVLGLVVAVPMSYLLGGRSLHLSQRRAEDAADTDALTGLAGRRPFRPMLQAALSTGSESTALALLDIDDFKRVNDRLGHSYGDRVLCDLATAFAALRASDTAFRLGGDEFAVVLTGSSEAQAVEALERVRRAFSVRAPGITFSCGVAAVTGSEDVSLQELWERADSALYEAKNRGRRRTVSFSATLTGLTVSADKLDAVSALLVDDGGLTAAFQPIWDLRAGRILGHEALLRLPPDSPIDGPQEAFELAQRLGLAAELDQQARRIVLQHVRARHWEGLLFLNVHPDALPTLDVDALAVEIGAAGLTPESVILEVTEHDGLDRPEPIRVLKRAHAHGFRLALDDMGAGNAGLRALTHVRFDVVKLDRQVIARLGIDPASDATVAAATTFVQQTGGWVVAEGIEDTDMLAAVLGDAPREASATAVVAGQGYLLGRPGPVPATLETRHDLLSAPASHRPSAAQVLPG